LRLAINSPAKLSTFLIVLRLPLLVVSLRFEGVNGERARD
jgi:hypothetical protein